jgi:phosphoribosyl-ATP pyrophosphohydrolase/phosphoribosyl-AMP cyclohydrolase/histidinol dehydrogenase
MTAVTARVAGVETVWVASPRPTAVTLAAAAVAGADALVAIGGAHAIAAFAVGCGDVPACDVIVGPGNRWVTAAKHLVSDRVRIDMLAGPSELLIIADASADSARLAADLLAQAEHDDDAVPMLIALDESIIDAVESELETQLGDLPTAGTARRALTNGFALVARDFDDAIDLADRIAPEHLELHVRDAASLAPRLRNYGGLFIGETTAEVFGDYGAGPNHTLPTGGTARFASGLSVFNFLKTPTDLRIDDPRAARLLRADAVALARLEGLEAHARSALAR